MKKYRHFWLLFLLAGLFFVGAAIVSGAPDTTKPEPQTVSMAEPIDDCDDQPAASTVTTSYPDIDVALGQSDDQACRDCHSDQERLQELAVEEEVESLSEGPG